jgi:hypothetical protein
MYFQGPLQGPAQGPAQGPWIPPRPSFDVQHRFVNDFCRYDTFCGADGVCGCGATDTRDLEMPWPYHQQVVWLPGPPGLPGPPVLPGLSAPEFACTSDYDFTGDGEQPPLCVGLLRHF